MKQGRSEFPDTTVDSEARDRKLIADIEEAMMMEMETGSAGGRHTWAGRARASYADAFKDNGTNPAEQAVAETAIAHTNLGNALVEQGQLDEAIASYREAIRLAPDIAALPHSNLGLALRKQGSRQALRGSRSPLQLITDHPQHLLAHRLCLVEKLVAAAVDHPESAIRKRASHPSVTSLPIDHRLDAGVEN
jgi:tetratricopeptide (TPR) repeat protein